MKEFPPRLAQPLRLFVATLYAVMTLVFITVPYALSFHPGDPSPPAAVAAASHPGQSARVTA